MGDAIAISQSADERWRAYINTHVRIEHPEHGSLVVSPDPSGTTSGEFPESSGGPIYIMTAYNPGRTLPEAENIRRQKLLLDGLSALPGISIWPALGGDPTWTHTEVSIAILGLDETTALAVARMYDQEAIFSWSVTAWHLVSCVDNRRWSAGWRIRLDS